MDFPPGEWLAGSVGHRHKTHAGPHTVSQSSRGRPQSIGGGTLPIRRHADARPSGATALTSSPASLGTPGEALTPARAARAPMFSGGGGRGGRWWWSRELGASESWDFHLRDKTRWKSLNRQSALNLLAVRCAEEIGARHNNPGRAVTWAEVKARIGNVLQSQRLRGCGGASSGIRRNRSM